MLTVTIPSVALAAAALLVVSATPLVCFTRFTYVFIYRIASLLQHKRASATVYSSCSKANTAALTFVSLDTS